MDYAKTEFRAETYFMLLVQNTRWDRWYINKGRVFRMNTILLVIFKFCNSNYIYSNFYDVQNIPCNYYY